MVNSRAEGLSEVEDLLKVLDGLADEDWIVEGFIPEALLIETSDGFRADIGLVIYELEAMGLRQLALDLRVALTQLES